MEFNICAKMKISDNIDIEIIEDGAIIINNCSGKALILNSTAYYIFDLLKQEISGAFNVDLFVRKFIQKYNLKNVDIKEVETDINNTIAHLYEEGIIIS